MDQPEEFPHKSKISLRLQIRECLAKADSLTEELGRSETLKIAHFEQATVLSSIIHHIIKDFKEVCSIRS